MSPAPALSLAQGHSAGSVFRVAVTSQRWYDPPLPHRVADSLFIESKGFFWISMVFYMQRIANMIADLV